MITLADIAAMQDVIKQVTAETDSLDANQAIPMRNALSALAKDVADAVAFLNTRALQTLEDQPITIKDTVYVPQKTGKWRPNQRKIRYMVVDRACANFDTGEAVTDPRLAAAQAVTVMYDLFVAPSQMPKQGGLDKLGRSYSDVADWEITGKKLKEVKVDQGPDD